MKPERFSSGNIDMSVIEPAPQMPSMKPERFSSGNHERLEGRGRRRPSFNEAGAFQLRKPVHVSEGGVSVVQPSMKPERFSSGNWTRYVIAAPQWIGLQ